MRIHTRRRRCKSSKVGQTRKYQQTKTEEELEKERERNRLYMRRLRASQSLEEVERRREKGRMYKRLSVLRRTPEEAARQREQNRLYMQRLRASQAPEEVERRREKGRIYKRLSLLNQTPEKAARQREQNKLYMRRLRASHTPEEVERRKERNRMYKRLSMLRRTPEETAKQKEQNRLYMRQLRANKVNEKTEKSRTQRLSLSHLNSEVEENRFSVGLLETSQTAEIPEQGKCIRTLEHQKQRSGSSDTKMNKAPQQEIVSPVIEMNKLFKMKGTDMDGYHAFNICHLRQTSAMEEVKREFDRQMWQCSGFWDYLALLNKTQPDQSKLHTAALETCEDECRKTERRN
ncbi:hypothetical protein B7P43_G14728 [Cryptotermes secundus]|nr:hypothetical protein B7P43_G14728 [Cryptotermes secundus]